MTAPKPDTLTAIFLEESHRWDTTAILRCEVRAESAATAKQGDLVRVGPVNGFNAATVVDDIFDTDEEIVTVKVYDAEEGEFESGMPYTFYGDWKEYTRKANKWNPKPAAELQFHARKWRKVKPYDKTGVIKWLKQCPGIKEGIARRLWEAYGADAIARLKDAPEEVATEIGGGFTEERARMASAHLQENDAMEAAFVDLASLLDGRGFPHTLPKRLVKDEGAEAANVVKRSPWMLLSYPRTGIARVDKLYCDLAKAKGEKEYKRAISAVKRQTIILRHCLTTASNGNTWQAENVAKIMLNAKIAGAEVKFQKAVRLGVRAGVIATRWDEDMALWLADAGWAADERYIAQRAAEIHQPISTVIANYQRVIEERVKKLDHTRCARCHRKLTAATVAILNGNPYGPDCITRIGGGEDAEQVMLTDWLKDATEIVKTVRMKFAGLTEVAAEFRWPDISTLNVSDHQRAVVVKAMVARWMILGGWPGSGKTYCLARIIAAMAEIVGLDNIAACCFTGKAAARLSEVLFEYGVKLRAKTIHSLLSGSKPKFEWGFAHNEDNPLRHKLIVIDEASMLGCGLFADLLRAVPRTSMLLIAGDYRQLPPIEHGRPLYDLIQAGVPYAEFQEVRRNSGTGVLACRAIIDGSFPRFKFDERFQLAPTEDDPNSPHNCKLVPTRSNAESVERIVEFLHALKSKTIPVNLKEPDGEKRPIDVIRDAIVVVATNGVKAGKSELSRNEINQRLQRELNPYGKQLAGSPFRDGDRIICLKNGWMPVVNEDSRYFDPEANQPGQAELSDDTVRVQNGELGMVIGQEEKIVYARFEAPLRVFKIPRGKREENGDGDTDDEDKTNTGCNFDLGFAITAHKSQGSQSPIVLFGIDETNGARMVLCREAVYTILSRFQWLQVLFGKRHVLDSFCKRLALAPRKTFLEEEIREEVDRLERERK